VNNTSFFVIFEGEILNVRTLIWNQEEKQWCACTLTPEARGHGSTIEEAIENLFETLKAMIEKAAP
jgi:predicted RNase H-like HicB family nuclease